MDEAVGIAEKLPHTLGVGIMAVKKLSEARKTATRVGIELWSVYEYGESLSQQRMRTGCRTTKSQRPLVLHHLGMDSIHPLLLISLPRLKCQCGI